VLAIANVIEVCATTIFEHVGGTTPFCVNEVSALDDEESACTYDDETRAKNSVPSDCALGTL
jgi:hypothetical protein